MPHPYNEKKIVWYYPPSSEEIPHRGKPGDVLCSGENGTTVWGENIHPQPDLSPQFDGGMFFNEE